MHFAQRKNCLQFLIEQFSAPQKTKYEKARRVKRFWQD